MKITIALLLLVALFCVISSATAARKGCIDIFEHNHYKGKKHTLCHSTTYKRFFKNFNDKVSSYCAGYGANWRLYQHSKNRGRSIFVKGGTCRRTMPSGMNDKVSSAVKYHVKTCRYVKTRKCRKVRRGPFFKNVKRRIAYTERKRIVKRYRKSYRHPICRSSRYRVSFRKPLAYNKKIRYSTYIIKSKRVYYTASVHQRIRKKRRVVKKIRRTRTKYRTFRVKKKRLTIKAYWQYYSGKCSYIHKYTRKHRVRAAKRYPCTRRYKGYKRVKRLVSIKKNIKKKWYTGRYIASGAPDCYKKEWKWRNTVVTVRVWKWRSVLVWKSRRATCTRYYWRTYITHHSIKKTKSCRKRRRRYKRIITYYYQIIKKGYTYVYYTTHISWKQYWAVIVKRVRKFRNVKYKVKIYRHKYIRAYRWVTSYRYATRVRTTYVTRYRTVYRIVSVLVRKYKYVIRKVAVRYFQTKCYIVRRKICR